MGTDIPSCISLHTICNMECGQREWEPGREPGREREREQESERERERGGGAETIFYILVVQMIKNTIKAFFLVIPWPCIGTKYIDSISNINRDHKTACRRLSSFTNCMISYSGSYATRDHIFHKSDVNAERASAT